MDGGPNTSAGALRCPGGPAPSWDGSADLLALAEALPHPVFVADAAGAVRVANARLRATFGSEDLQGRPWQDILHPVDRGPAVAGWARAASSGGIYEARHRLAAAADDGRWVLCRIAPVTDNGEVVRWIGTCSETDAPERASDAASYRAIFEQAGVGVARVGLDGRILEANAKFLSILGYGAEELCAVGFQGITHPEDLETDLANVEALLAGRIATYAMEKRYITRSGDIVWAHLTVGLVCDRDGRPDFFVSVIKDITERRRTDDRLRASEARFRALIENAPEKMWINRPDGSVEYFNAAWRRFTNQPETPHGTDWIADIHPEDRPHMLAKRRVAVESGLAYNVEVRIRSAESGHWRWHLGSVAPLRDADGAIFAWVGTAADIDAVRRADEERRATAARDAVLLTLEDRMHDQADPTAVMIVAADLLAEDLAVDRVCYGEVDEAAGTYRIVAGRAPEISSGVMDFRFRLEEFGGLATALRSGQPFVCPDVQGDRRLESVRGAAGRKLGTLGAMLCVPLIRDGRLVVVLSVESRALRSWTQEEIRLVEEVAARTWSAVERARSERRLRETEERYRLLASATNDVIWDWDLLSGQEVWNEALQTRFGHAFTVADATWGTERIHPEDRERVDREFLALVEGSGSIWSCEYRFERADGTYADVLDRGYVLRDERGRALRVIGALMDLTERKVAERELRDREAWLRIATEAADIGTWDFDAVADTLRWDARCKALFGLSPDAVVTWAGSFLSGLHPEDRDRTVAAVQAALSPGGTGTYDVEYRTIGIEDGVERWIAAKGRTVFADDRPMRFIGTVLDVTEQRRTEAALAELNAELERRVEARTEALQATARALEAEMRQREEAQSRLLQAQKLEALGQVVGGVAHDFNNVLAAIQGAFNILNRRVTDENLRFAISEGRKAGDRAAALVRQMLAFARRQPTEPQVIDPGALLPALRGMVRHAVGPGVTMDFDVPPDVWPVLADPHQLEVALLNLAVNARDAMPGGGHLTVTARNMPAETTRAGDFGAGDRVAISVADTGCGMDEATLARAFEPFFTTKEPGKGTGLGLAQVHGVVQSSGGTLRAESVPGQGTTVSLLLPRSAVRSEERAGPAASVPQVADGATILLVDDDDQVRPITAALLRDLGHVVVEAPSAAVATALAHVHEIDLLLTDVVMPGTDGPSLARSLRLDRPGLPVIFITGYAAEHCLEGETVVGKPFTSEELGRRVAEALWRGRDGGAGRGGHRMAPGADGTRMPGQG